MRLLNTQTLKLTEFYGSDIPEYAILSHTWGPDGEEVSFKDIQEDRSTWNHKQGATKVTDFCRLADMRGYDWVWIDTCCIDKSSSAELSEAINSMYQWYKESHVCFVYLSDVTDIDSFRKSRWFTRGWTLQELLAPTTTEFYDKRWAELGNKMEMKGIISATSGIEADALIGRFQPDRYTAAVKMSWASTRTTTRVEDRAYSLLGIFGVNMPLLYGEGIRAFQRLQEEILRVTEDYTLFAWVDGSAPRFEGAQLTMNHAPVLASTPSNFRYPSRNFQNPWDYADLRPIIINPFISGDGSMSGPDGPEVIYLDRAVTRDHEPPRLTARGLRITLPFIEHFSPGYEEFYSGRGITPEQCHLAFTYLTVHPRLDLVCLLLREHEELDVWGDPDYHGQHHRTGDGILVVQAKSISVRFKTVYLRTKSLSYEVHEKDYFSATCVLAVTSNGIRTLKVYSPTGPRITTHILIRHDSLYFHLVAFYYGFKSPSCFLIASQETTPTPSEVELKRVTQAIYDLKQQLKTELPLPGGDIVRAVMRIRPLGWVTRQVLLGLLPLSQLEHINRQFKLGVHHVYTIDLAVPTNVTTNIGPVSPPVCGWEMPG
jgi:hypothetical protein